MKKVLNVLWKNPLKWGSENNNFLFNEYFFCGA